MTTRRFAVRRDPVWTQFPLRQPTLADAPVWGASVVIGVGIIVLLGWMLDIHTLKSVLPGLPTMKANTAVCFTLLGAGVVLLARAPVVSPSRRIGLGLIAAAALIAAATGAQYVNGIDLGIDQLLFREQAGEIGTIVAGRMAPLTAICFLLIALAAFTNTRAPRIVIALSGLALAVSVLNVFDVVFDAAVPPFLAGYTQMALSTAVAMGILAVGVLGLLGPADPLALFAGRSPTVLLLRRMLAVVIAGPVLMIWLTLEGQRLGLFDASYGTALRLVGILALGIVAILRSARWATGLERKRETLEVERDRFFELSLDMLCVIGADGRFDRVNKAWETVLGYPAGDFIGRPSTEHVHPDDLDRTNAESLRLRKEGDLSVAFQNRYRHRDGSYRWLEWMSQTGPDKTIAYAVARDVTDRKRREDRRATQQRVLESRNEALSERAIRDPLTGLHDRGFFDEAVADLERRLAQLPIDEQPSVSLIIFDLDHFGQVNKRHGHQAGDAGTRT